MYVFTSKTAAEEYVNTTNLVTSGKVTTKTLIKELDGKIYVFDAGSNQVCSSKEDVQKLQEKQSNAFIDAGSGVEKL